MKFRLTLLNERDSLNLLRLDYWLYWLVINYWLSIRNLLNKNLLNWNLLNWNLLNWKLININRIRCLMLSWINLRKINRSRIPIRLLICLITNWRLFSLTCSPFNSIYLDVIKNLWFLLPSSHNTEI